MTQDKQSGTVKWFNKEKGYGFIKSDSGEDVFVHIRDLMKSNISELQKDEPVYFDLMADKKNGKTKAISVQRMD